MKKLLITSFLTLAASLAYAGGSCCEKKTDSKDKDAGKSGAVEAPATLACSGEKSGDEDKDAKTGLNQSSLEVAGSGCGGDKGDKQCDKKADFNASTSEFAGGDCGGDKGDKKCETKCVGVSTGSAIA